ncbi:Bifunctional nuclease 1 [Acorus gramineus]|uniref:Bifunctional nuclease 1 n=1 Tax=Acorus gramineus TaxID=55184 RepID=A0AAV9AZG7_ACOGR|nr:Bifunctional nuclease 1 [Acorus gramineus]
MGTLQGPVICRPTVRAKQTVAFSSPVSGSLIKVRSGIWGSKRGSRARIRVGPLTPQHCVRRNAVVHCAFSSSSDGNGSMAENFSENDEDYVNSSVVEAVEVKSGSEGFLIKMRDGRHMRCVHNNPQGGNVPDYAPHPAIVLKMEDGSDLLLPIIVLEMPSVLLMAAVRNVPIARPTLYQIMKEMIEKMGYTVVCVECSLEQNTLFLTIAVPMQVGNEMERICFDLRPSDAINIAVRCKVPIQVNKHLAYNDGMRVVEPAKLAMQIPTDGLLFTEMDRPDGQPCIETKEFCLIRNMKIAAVEERYRDAGMV